MTSWRVVESSRNYRKEARLFHESDARYQHLHLYHQNGILNRCSIGLALSPLGTLVFQASLWLNWNTALPRAHSPGKTERLSKSSFRRSTLRVLTETRLKPMAGSGTRGRGKAPDRRDGYAHCRARTQPRCKLSNQQRNRIPASVWASRGELDLNRRTGSLRCSFWKSLRRVDFQSIPFSLPGSYFFAKNVLA
jgi:hypothetical protein